MYRYWTGLAQNKGRGWLLDGSVVERLESRLTRWSINLGKWIKVERWLGCSLYSLSLALEVPKVSKTILIFLLCISEFSKITKTIIFLLNRSSVLEDWLCSKVTIWKVNLARNYGLNDWLLSHWLTRLCLILWEGVVHGRKSVWSRWSWGLGWLVEWILKVSPVVFFLLCALELRGLKSHGVLDRILFRYERFWYQTSEQSFKRILLPYRSSEWIDRNIRDWNLKSLEPRHRKIWILCLECVKSGQNITLSVKARLS